MHIQYYFEMEADDVYAWDPAKNEQLARERGLSFEDVVEAIQDGRLLEDRPHHNLRKFAHQRILVVEIDGYVCAVPYVENAQGRFLKTIYRSRDLRRLFGAKRKS